MLKNALLAETQISPFWPWIRRSSPGVLRKGDAPRRVKEMGTPEERTPTRKILSSPVLVKVPMGLLSLERRLISSRRFARTACWDVKP